MLGLELPTWRHLTLPAPWGKPASLQGLGAPLVGLVV